MDSIITVKIESGQTVQVAFAGSSDQERIERGPQVLILASSERVTSSPSLLAPPYLFLFSLYLSGIILELILFKIVGATFPLNARNASFKPEFNWHIPTTHSNFPSFSNDSHSYSLPFDSYASPTPSYSFSFDSPASATPSNLYDVPGTFDSAPTSYSFSFENDSPQNGNRYSFGDESLSPQFAFVVHEDEADERGSESSETIEQRLARLLYLFVSFLILFFCFEITTITYLSSLLHNVEMYEQLTIDWYHFLKQVCPLSSALPLYTYYYGKDSCHSPSSKAKPTKSSTISAHLRI